ncbi:hypothetical protein BDQ17DRAFT_1428933 [Cyathus striatus]|nr:hypothetical protein BDQ17DRAFT_1428933 [Cyathus striatus]
MPLIMILYIIATISTIFRLIYRARCRQLWWDDFWASLALVNAVLLFAAYIQTAFDFSPIRLSSFVLVMVTSRMALWSSRLSVAVTVVRIIATGKSLLISKIVAVMFGTIGIGLIVQKAILCPSGVNFTCRDTLSNITAYTDLAMKKDAQAHGVIAHIKVTISLIVCNLLFLVTYLYRQLRSGQEYTEDTTTSAPSRKPSDSYNTTSYFGQTQSSSTMTSVYISNFSGSQPNVDRSRILYESEPGIIERQWPSVGGIRGVITV